MSRLFDIENRVSTHIMSFTKNGTLQAGLVMAAEKAYAIYTVAGASDISTVEITSGNYASVFGKSKELGNGMYAFVIDWTAASVAAAGTGNLVRVAIVVDGDSDGAGGLVDSERYAVFEASRNEKDIGHDGFNDIFKLMLNVSDWSISNNQLHMQMSDFTGFEDPNGGTWDPATEDAFTFALYDEDGSPTNENPHSRVLTHVMGIRIEDIVTK